LKKLKKIFFIFIILLAVDISGVVIFYLNCISYNKDVKDLTECDAGVVFFHSFDKQNQLSDESKKRLDMAYQCFENHKITNIICVGGWNWKYPMYGSLKMKKYLVSKGIPENIIFNDTLSYSSLSNWREACKIIDKNGWNKILLISSPTHLPRLMHIVGGSGYQISAVTFHPDYSYIEIWEESNIEFAKWTAVSLFPEKFIDKFKNFLRLI
jgi:vancomycin permeability regulator SanA